jgi:hypothetical protein
MKSPSPLHYLSTYLKWITSFSFRVNIFKTNCKEIIWSICKINVRMYLNVISVNIIGIVSGLHITQWHPPWTLSIKFIFLDRPFYHEKFLEEKSLNLLTPSKVYQTNCNLCRRYWIFSWAVTLEVSARRCSDKPVKIYKWKLQTSTTLHANRRERDDTNVTNDDVFRTVCTAYLRPILVICADMTHSPWENPTPVHYLLNTFDTNFFF